MPLRQIFISDNNKTYVGLSVKCTVLFSVLKQICIISTDFLKSPPYEISRKYVHWESRLCTRIKGRTDGWTDLRKLIGIFVTMRKRVKFKDVQLKVKVKKGIQKQICTCTRHEGVCGERRYITVHANIGTRWKWAVSCTVQLPYPAGYLSAVIEHEALWAQKAFRTLWRTQNALVTRGVRPRFL
jgi:hypothetical protein